MNIRDYWPLTDEVPCTEEVWFSLLQMRLSTFQGFAEIEKKQGIIHPTVSVSTAHGQEVLRMLAFRTLEELGEAYLSVEPDHYYEELIDAFNYLTSALLLSGQIDEKLPALFVEAFENRNTEVVGFPPELNHGSLGKVTVMLGAELGDSLRNRAWMKNVQNSYFDLDLFKQLSAVFIFIFRLFPDFKTFWCYYVAKDAVLQFRLRSNY